MKCAHSVTTLLRPVIMFRGTEVERFKLLCINFSHLLHFFLWHNSPNQAGSLLRFLDHTPHTVRHTTISTTPLNEWTARWRGRYLHNKQKTVERNIHEFSGIGIRDSSNRAAADLCMQPHGLRDRFLLHFLHANQTRFGFSKPSSACVQNNYTKSRPIVMWTADATKTVESKHKQKETRSTTETKTTEGEKYYKRKE